jgi:hypothetical protein
VCQLVYKWTQLTKDVEFQGIGKELQDVLEDLKMFKETMKTLAPTKNMVAIMVAIMVSYC